MDTLAAAEAAHTGMGTEMVHRAFGGRSAEALEAVMKEAGRLERRLSRFLPESDIRKVNRKAGAGCEKIGPEAFEILRRAAEFSENSRGLFDITVGPLADLWDYKHASAPPPPGRIEKVLPLVDHRALELDPVRQTAGLKYPGQSLDLGGIAKGFAGDRFMEVFGEYGVISAFSNIGGNVSTLGNKPDGAPWVVGIRHPRRNSLIGAVAVTGKAVVTSGDYERYFLDKNGRRYHHILDPAAGYPAESGLISVTVAADDAMTADALSTALFVAGLEKGAAILEKYPQAGAVLADADLRLYVTKGLRGSFLAPAGTSADYI